LSRAFWGKIRRRKYFIKVVIKNAIRSAFIVERSGNMQAFKYKDGRAHNELLVACPVFCFGLRRPMLVTLGILSFS
jgi:hypothetical protein